MRTTRRRAVTVLAVAIALVMSAASAFGVTFGEPDDGEHPNVGLVVFQDQFGFFYLCSGTLIHEQVVLTAGHCTESGGAANPLTFVIFEEDLSSGWVPHFGTAVPHPMYDDFSGFPATYDIGVVVLDAPVMGITPAGLPDAGYLDTVKGKDKKGFEVVGYGLQGVIQPFYGDDLARHKGDVSLVEVSSKLTNKGLSSAKFTNSPGLGNGSGGSCFGDSGGPVFRGDTVVAVVSFGYTPCIGVDFQYRVDTQDSLDFIDSVITALP